MSKRKPKALEFERGRSPADYRPRVEAVESRILLNGNAYKVITTQDDGLGTISGSLSWAIGQVNSDLTDTAATPDKIVFDILGTGPFAISPTSSLPALKRPVVIDGTTQPGFDARSPAPIIQINGQNNPARAGLALASGSGGSTIKGLDVGGFSTGISLESNNNTIGVTAVAGGNVISGNTTGVAISGTGNCVAGNKIGTDSFGQSAIPNGIGVLIEGGATNNTVGGTVADAGNVISGNTTGVDISGTANLVAGNKIGTGGLGLSAIPNNTGVLIVEGVTDNTIGGTVAGAANLISGNRLYGVDILGTDNLVTGNEIGTDFSVSISIPNSFGVSIEGQSNTIGGTAPGAANVISGNNTIGVAISGTANCVAGNLIGTDSSGTSAIPNAIAGVSVDGQSNTIGGTAPGAANVISGNREFGVHIVAGTANCVAGNLIGTDSKGTKAIPNGTGVWIELESTDNTIGGTVTAAANVISGNLASGVDLEGSGTTGNIVAGNFIGTDVSGMKRLGNDTGVRIAGGASNNTVVGISDGSRNVISGNLDSGVDLEGIGTSDNLVKGNYIGTDLGATASLSNPTGVLIGGGATQNTIGALNVDNPDGSTVFGGNIISGNLNNGVQIAGVGSSRNTIEGNLIGTNAILAYNPSLGDDVGVLVDNGATDNTIGTGNVIALNATAGIEISGIASQTEPQTSQNVVAGNFIGTDPTGNDFLGNQVGVLIDESATYNTVGGSSMGARNVISSNLGSGVDIRGSQFVALISNVPNETSWNTVTGNFIGTDATGMYTQSQQGGGRYNPVGVLLEAGARNNIIGGLNKTPDGTPLLSQGNLISGNPSAGIEITGTGSNYATEDNVVEGNFIGTDVSGTTTFQPSGYPLGNGTGVLIVGGQAGAYGNRVGGTTAFARNLISGNLVSGVEIGSSGGFAGASQNIVEGNYIGTDIKGTQSLGNVVGVLIDSGADSNTVGGPDETNSQGEITLSSGNLISGNTTGIDISGAANNDVTGNFIGTDPAGTIAVPNNVGVTIEGASSHNIIGGSTAGGRNVVSGNIGAGVVINGGGAMHNLLEGNYIGIDVDGGFPVSNGIGVLITAGADQNTVGGITNATQNCRNIISGNADSGVEILGFQTSSTQDAASTIAGNWIEGNYIGTNATGTIAVGNNVGVLLSNAPDNTIGGTATGAGNAISGNASTGVQIVGSGSTNESLMGNFIGPDASGDKALPASALSDPTKSVQQTGILINGSVGNSIGKTSEPRNVISGNVVGIEFTGITATPGETTTNTVTSSYIGIGNDQKALGNVIGIWVNNVPNIKIEGNTISGNSQGGVYISGANAKNNMVQGNRIGLGPHGQTYTAKGHETDPTYQFPIGVYIENASSNMIGGTGSARNTISGNSVGVYIFGAGGSSRGNTISGNTINGNERYGILLFNAPFNTNSRNQFARNKIANFREFSGPVGSGGATQTSSSGQSSGTKAKNLAHQSKPAEYRSARRNAQAAQRTISLAAVTVHGRHVPAGPIRKHSVRVIK